MDCTGCGHPLAKSALGPLRYSLPSRLLFALGGVVSFVWIFGLTIWRPLLVPKAPRDLLAYGPIYLAPGFSLGWIARKLPRVRRVICSRCGWREGVIPERKDGEWRF